MQKDRRITILTTSFGAGHLKAAQAVEQAMGEKDATCQSKLIDSFISTAPRLTRAIMRLYLRILACFPFLYGILYDWGNWSKAALWGRQLVSIRLSTPTRRQLAEFPAHAVICTHASPTGAVCQLKKQGILTVPIIAVVTDFIVHRLWIYDEVDIYTVAHEKVGSELIDAGIAPAKIRVTGIPIASKFSSVVDKIKVRQRLELTDGIPTVLIMGGGTGALPMDKMVEEFRRCTVSVQLLVVTGSNEPLFKRLNRMAKNFPTRVFGFVDNIHELMAVSDLLITKPGGLSAAEALVMGTPLILFRPIPGQEEGNAQFLIDEGVACRIDNMEDIPDTVSKLLQDREQLVKMRNKARALAKPQAAQTVAEITFNLSEESR